MANQVSIPLYEEIISDFEEVSAATRQSEAVQRVRQKGFENFKKLGFPTRRNEEWKYTNITPYLQEKYLVDAINTSAAQNELVSKALIPHLDCYKLVLVNGQLQTSQNGV